MWRIPLRTTATVAGVNRDGTIRYNSETRRQQLQQKLAELSHVANNVYELPSTAQAIRYLHAACGFPVKSTWIKAIKRGNYVGWPFLTAEAVSKHFPESVETLKGHLDQTRQHTRSTQSFPTATEEALESRRGKKKRDIYIKVFEMRGTVYSDQTGRFPKKLRSNKKYIMVMIEIDSNCILVEAMSVKRTMKCSEPTLHCCSA